MTHRAPFHDPGDRFRQDAGGRDAPPPARPDPGSERPGSTRPQGRGLPAVGRYSRTARNERAQSAARPPSRETGLPDGTGAHPVREPERREHDEHRASGDPAPERDGPADDAADDAADAAAPRRRMRPGDRRFLEAMALVTLLPALVGLHWLDDTRNIQQRLERPEKPTTVAKGKVGVLADTRWLFVRRTVARAPLNPDPDVAEVRMVVAIKPLTQAGAKTVGSFGMSYRLRDGEGHIWSATAVPSSTPRAGAIALLTVKGVLPRSKAQTVTLEVRPPTTYRPKEPLPSLRFAS
ncbi:hypothetical protein Acsp04_48900 [Actinomadura sp. NBRC 104425]|uniref:hypothetical protein n=1 Tax=Actinomadura sp. NBRC 104425 TaxID=3032204 RepID=UPI0024A0D9F0|nr:hypothetical protein [Actinomadura sp. NBRC 104425]GLZ14655.1 hypothetical protein Acsp04_48900 [Actinomadura sp. NBRC 104425]